jgi:glycosyltransferase involved in cell wall biosynthesis
MPVRVMWLLNHTGARRFEVPMLKRLGFTEIFLPKRYPNDPGFRSASIDFSEDVNLTIPNDDLQILNAADWYDDPGPQAMAIANRHFRIAFFIMHQPGIFKSLADGFNGAMVWRVYGLSADTGYGRSIDHYFGHGSGPKLIRALRSRFWFGEAYDHLHHGEPSYLQNRSVFLPVGLPRASADDEWSGSDRRFLFVCPDIGVNPYYEAIYQTFCKDFSGLPHVVGGAQPIHIADPNVLGFAPLELYRRNMRELRAMYYHSTEPNHIHYHPFEAIQTGMPLVFMGGGMLDRFGGRGLPGRCASVAEARSKISRILDDDKSLIEEIRATQPRLLLPLSFEAREPAWRDGMDRILEALARKDAVSGLAARTPRRIAVILPEPYRGGTLLGAKLLAGAIRHGSSQSGEAAEVIFAHLDDKTIYSDDDFNDLPPGITVRPFTWIRMPREQASRTMTLAGLGTLLTGDEYICPDDGIQQFLDCDLWVFVSDRFSFPILPIRPYVLMIYDYLQRYFDILPYEVNASITAAARRAARVLVTTEFTKQDAIQFAGVSERNIVRVPMLAPEPTEGITKSDSARPRRYFLWTTNAAAHKNHVISFKALAHYYDILNGALDCRVTGVNSRELLASEAEHSPSGKPLMDAHSATRKRLKLLGELPYQAYLRHLSGAEFLWHTSRLDNGTFAMIEAAHCGVPTLSSDYPAIREEAAQFGLAPAWFDPLDSCAMAQQLKHMETKSQAMRDAMPTVDQMAKNSVQRLARTYWEAIRACL